MNIEITHKQFRKCLEYSVECTSQEIILHGADRVGVLGHSLGSLGHGVLGELPGQDEADSGLDVPGDDGGPLVVES